MLLGMIDEAIRTVKQNRPGGRGFVPQRDTLGTLTLTLSRRERGQRSHMLPLDRHGGFDDRGEVLHAFEAGAQAVAAEIEDEFTDPEAGIGGDVLDYLSGGARKRPAFQPALAL